MNARHLPVAAPAAAVALYGYSTRHAGLAAELHAAAGRHGAVHAPDATGGVPSGAAYAAARHTSAELDVAVAGNPRWEGPTAEGTGLAAWVAAEYRRTGDGFLRCLRDDFAVAVVDRRAHRVLLAVDRVGVEPLAWRRDGDTVVFASRADVVAAAGGARPELRQQALFDFLLLHMIPSPDTVYAGVVKLEPGTCVIVGADGATVKRYWDPVFVEGASTTPEPVLAERLRGTLETSVAHRAPDAGGGAFLSGGLDSSTVAGMLAKARGAGANTFSIGFGIEGYDELDYARIASRHFRTTPHEYSVTPEDVVDAIPRIAAAYDEPFGNSSAVPTYFCARLAKQHGVDHLLAGDGGDELFGGNERYARQKVFEAYGSLPGWLRSGLVEPLAGLVRPEHPFMPLRKFRSYVDQASVPMPERMEHWNFMYRADLDAMLEPDVRRAIEPQRALAGMRAVWASTSATALVNRMLFYDWHYTLADNDLRKVRRMCELGGIRVSFPMLDDRLVDLSLEVTPRQKVDGSNLRAFYKRALGEFLPRAIIDKQKHGFGLPFGVWLKTHRPLAELVYSLLGDLKKRRMVRAAFLDQLIEEHRSGHPSFYGYAIWDLAMLEAWLAVHAAR